jgi:hypothetical protein
MDALDAADRELIERYDRGVEVVERALSTLSEDDLDRRAGADEWTVRQVVHHLADSETHSYTRLRRLLVDPAPVIIQAYDEAAWAGSDLLGYASLPIEQSLAVFRAVRAASSRLLARVRAQDLSREGVHTESGGYSVRDWLRIYAAHAEDHAAQIERASRGDRTAERGGEQ